MAEVVRRGLSLEAQETLDVESPQSWFHTGQLEAWNAEERFVLILAGTQGGKSAMAPWLALREAKRTFKPDEPNEGLVASPSFPLQDVKLSPEFRRVICSELQIGEWVGSPSPKITIKGAGLQRLTGSDRGEIVMRFGYATKPESLESATYKWAIGDEFGQPDVKNESIDAILRRLSINQGRLFMPTTPYTLGWLKDRFHDKAGTGGIRVVRFESIMNPVFPKEEWERAKNDLPPWKFDMFYRGIFTRPAAAVYDCLDRHRHGIDRFPIPAAWPKYPGVDFGPNNTGAVLFTEELSRERGPNGPVWGKKTGRYVLYRSYKPGMSRSADQHVASIRSGESLLLGAGGANTEDGWRQAFAAAGMPLANPPNIGVEAQIANVYRWLVDGKLIIFNDLREVWDELESYSREMGSDGEPTEKIDDKSKFHLCDAIRYLCAHLDPPKQPFKSSKGRPGRWA